MNRQQAGKLAFAVVAASTVSCGSSAKATFDTLLPASPDTTLTPTGVGVFDAWAEVKAKDAAESLDRAGVDDVREAGGRDAAKEPISINVAPGESPGTAHVVVTLTDVNDPISSVAVSALPDNVTATAAAASLTVAGLAPQTTHTFNVTATTSTGSVFSASAGPLAFYDVIETFTEPECADNTVFRGSFSFEKQNGRISNLRGTLTEAMYAGPPTVLLTFQLSTQPVNLGGASGLLIATFAIETTDTFSTGGFAPGGTKTYGNHNAYALVFVNTDDPTTPLTSEQVNWLAYADCTPQGLMGKTCMTGTSAVAYGRTGTMAAYPISQVTTLR